MAILLLLFLCVVPARVFAFSHQEQNFTSAFSLETIWISNQPSCCKPETIWFSQNLLFKVYGNQEILIFGENTQLLGLVLDEARGYNIRIKNFSRLNVFYQQEHYLMLVLS